MQMMVAILAQAEGVAPNIRCCCYFCARPMLGSTFVGTFRSQVARVRASSERGLMSPEDGHFERVLTMLDLPHPNDFMLDGDSIDEESNSSDTDDINNISK